VSIVKVNCLLKKLKKGYQTLKNMMKKKKGIDKILNKFA